MEQSKAKPLYVSGSVLLVLIPSTVALLLLYYVVPALLERTGRPFLLGYLPWWIGFMTLYFIVSIVAYRLEGNELSWKAFAERFRLKKVRGKDWWWLAALMVSFLIVGITLALLGDRLSAIPFMAPPSFFPPELDPSSPGGLIPGEFMGMPLAGRWWIPLVYFFGWILNILGDEFWFGATCSPGRNWHMARGRGYYMPSCGRSSTYGRDGRS